MSAGSHGCEHPIRASTGCWLDSRVLSAMLGLQPLSRALAAWCGLGGSVGVRPEQLVEQRAVVHHRMAQLLRVDLTGPIGLFELVSGTVVAHDATIAHRQIRHALLEVFDGVAARQHYTLHQL